MELKRAVVQDPLVMCAVHYRELYFNVSPPPSCANCLVCEENSCREYKKRIIYDPSFQEFISNSQWKL
jgi:hypothetical protein